MSTATTLPVPRAVDLLGEKVSTALKSNPYLQCRNLRFETSERRVALHGQVSSWYQKQMAQEMLMRMDGIDAVDNHLEVHWTKEGIGI
jgi:osmotically-inducible protein OsmY